MNSGARRFNFGMTGLADGIEFVALSMAIYGIAEVVYNLEKKQETRVVSGALGRVWPSLADLRYCAGSILRGTGLGAMLGVLPGGGALLAAFAAYTLEKNVARPPRHFGHGDIRGVAAPESANNGGAQTSFIPMLTLGIPGNPTMAMMIGALMIHGIAPGPRVMTDRPGLFWGLIASMWLGNLMLVILNLPMVGVWVRLLRVPYRLLYPAIIVFCCIGAYTINSKPFDAVVMAFFAIFGYVALKLDCEPAPLILGFVLGPMMEENLRRALLISRGDPMVFVQEPISLGFLLVAAGLLVVIAAPAIRAQARGGAEGIARSAAAARPIIERKCRSLRAPEQAGDRVPDHLRHQCKARDRLGGRRRGERRPVAIRGTMDGAERTSGGGDAGAAAGRSCAELVLQALGELIHQLRGGRLDDADAAAVLRDRARQRQIGVHQHLRSAAGRLEPEHRGGIGAAAAFRVGALRRDARRVGRLVDVLELDDAGEGQSHRPEPHADLALVGVLADHLGQLRSRHAGRDALDVEQHLPGFGRRQRHFE